ncbi:MAG: glutamine synthetase family protein [Pseudomonadota bacterium]
MTAFEDRLKAQRDNAPTRVAALRDAGVTQLVSAYPDTQGNLRTKMGPLKYAATGESFNGIFYCTGHGDGLPGDDFYLPSPVCSEAEGYPNILAIADMDTAYAHPWSAGTASVLLDSYMPDGSRCAVDPRALVERLDAAARAQGIETRFALEYECGIFRADAERIAERRFGELDPWGFSLMGYNNLRSAEYQAFVAEFIARCAALDISISAFSTEHGYGMYEFGLAPATALKACDDAVRAKYVLRELCNERGLVITFMARFRPPGQESASGAHHHVSLWQGDTPATLDSDGEFSAPARQFLAGMLDRLVETHLLFRPTLNAYRRMERAAWSPLEVSWGLENRTAAVRAIKLPDARAARFEHRVSGSDINPYHTVAGLLAAGCDGVTRALELPAPAGPVPSADTANLPATLQASIEHFEQSAFSQEAFGSECHQHLARSARSELEAFQAWYERHITEFEWQRYFQTA